MYSDEQIRQIILEMQSESEYLRDTALKVINETTDSRFLEIALMMLDEEDYEPVRAAIVTLRNLENFNPPQFLPRVTEFLDVPSHCATVIWFIWSVGDATYVPKLLRFLVDSDRHVRAKAFETIARYGYHDLLEIALFMMNDDYSHIRSIACSVLSRFSDESRIFDILISKLHDDGEATLETVGSRIAISFGEKHDKRAIQPLMDAVRYGHERLAFRAFLALRDMQISSFESFCSEQIHNPHESVRYAILDILRKNPQASYMASLISLVETDASLSIKFGAVHILSMIKHPMAVEFAENWLKKHKRDT